MATPVIEVSELVFGYGGKPVLNGVNLTLYEGEFVAFIGQNGAGKTTLAKHFNGIHRPQSGSVRVMGEDTKGKSVAQLAAHVGYCYQNPDHQIFCATVREELEFGPTNLGKSREGLPELLEGIVGIVGLRCSLDAYPFSLSKGERQKLAVASILAVEPAVLVIDEPTTGLDWRGSLGMMNVMRDLNRKGHTIVMITHDMRLVADYASRVIVLTKGEVKADGSPRQVFSDSGRLAESYLQPPQVTRVAQSLAGIGLDSGLLSIDEVADAYLAFVDRGDL